MVPIIWMFFIVLPSAKADSVKNPLEQCSRPWKKVGCFHDRIIPNRPLPFELVNRIDQFDKTWDGHLVDWETWPQSLHALACKCATLTKKRGHRYFGLQFYGECWSGPSQKYDRDGASKSCVGDDYMPCDDEAPTECVGKAFTNYIYDTYVNSSVPTPGGWSAWSPWSACTFSCAGGEKERTRTCTNPVPEAGGKQCEGERSEVKRCNEEACPPVCENIIDIAVITDASTSVTSKNYVKVKDFVVKMTEVFHVGENKTHFAMIHFSWKAHLDFNFQEKTFWDPVKLREKIKRSKYIYGGTRTDLALSLAEKEIFCSKCGTRPKVPKVLIVITDGKSSQMSSPMSIASKGLKEKGVMIISLGIGSEIDRNELIEIAEDENHVFVSSNFDEMIDRLNKISRLSCNGNV